jgi:hypothetical protein
MAALKFRSSRYYKAGLGVVTPPATTRRPHVVRYAATYATKEEAAQAVPTLRRTQAGKKFVFSLTNDDVDAYGTEAIKTVLDTISIDDGTGEATQVPGLNLAFNTKYLDQGTGGIRPEYPVPNAAYLNWTRFAALLNKDNVCGSNHLSEHGTILATQKDDDPGSVAGARYQLKRGDEAFTLHTGKYANVVTIPAGLDNVVQASMEEGYIRLIESGSWGSNEPLADGYDPFYDKNTSEFYQRNGSTLLKRPGKMMLINRQQLDDEFVPGWVNPNNGLTGPQQWRKYVDDFIQYVLDHPEGEWIKEFFTHRPRYDDPQRMESLGLLAQFVTYIALHPRVQGELWWPNIEQVADWQLLLEVSVLSARTLSADGLTAYFELDVEAMGPRTRYNDHTVQFNGTPTAIVVEGAESFTVNLEKRFANVYKRHGVAGLATVPIAPAPVPYTTGSILPIMSILRDSWQDNNVHGDPGTGLEGLFDGNPEVQYTPGGGAAMIEAVHSFTILFPKEWDAIPRRLRWNDSFGNNIDNPTRFYFLRRDTQEWAEVLQFKGDEGYENKEYPHEVAPENQVICDGFRAVGNDYPTNLFIDGDYRNTRQPRQYLLKHDPVHFGMGLNGFSWDWQICEWADSDSSGLNPHKVELWKWWRGGFRQFASMDRWEPLRNQRAISPLLGGPRMDVVGQATKDVNIPWYLVNQQAPQHIQDTYPRMIEHLENVTPILYDDPLVPGDILEKRKNPLAHRFTGKWKYDVQARYGQNKNIDPATLTPWWNGAEPWEGVNTTRLGLDFPIIIEARNEPDGDWHGRLAYNSGEELFWQLSMDFDGHLGMFPNMGVRAADPNAEMACGGFAYFTPDKLMKIINLSLKHRGRHPNGTPNVPFTRISAHLYPNNEGANQRAPSDRAVPADMLPIFGELIDAFVYVIDTYLNGEIPLDITEVGNDVRQGSVLRAKAREGLTAEDVQAINTARTFWHFKRHKVSRIMWYIFRDDVNGIIDEPDTRFVSSGFHNIYPRDPDPAKKNIESNWVYEPRYAALIMRQIDYICGNHTITRQLSEWPLVDEMQRDGGDTVLALMLPVETNTITENYTVTAPNGCIEYRHRPGANTPTEIHHPAGPPRTFVVGEMPMYVRIL